MRKYLAYGLCLLGGVLLAVMPAAAQEQAVTVHGFVTDAETSRPLIGANVRLTVVGDRAASPRGSATNNEGYYRIPNLSPGRYALYVSHVGYRSLHDTLRLRGNQEMVTRSIELVPAERELGEVTVRSEDRSGATSLEAGRQTIRPEDVDRIPTPAAGGDLTMYLKSLPGVVATGDRGGQLYVRGGAPDQNLVLMDGALVYLPFHIVGFFSAFPQDLISSVDFYAGGYPAQYSGRLSSVIDAELRGGNKERYAASLSGSPLVAGATIEGPIRKGESSFLVSVRRSLIEPTSPVLIGKQQPLYFEDQIVKYQKTSALSRCSVTGLHTYDRGQVDPARQASFRWANYTLGGRCVVVPEETSTLANMRAGFSGVSNAVRAPETQERRAGTWGIYTDVDLTYHLDEGRTLRWGFHGRANQTWYHLLERFKGVRTDEDFVITTHGYLGGTFSLWEEHLTLNPSLGVTLPFGYDLSVAPRLRASWRPWGTEAQELSAALGLYHQFVQGISDERDAGSVFTAWIPQPIGGGRAKAWHAILGWQQQIGPVRGTIEGYYKRLADLPVPVWSTSARFTTELDLAQGRVYGADLRLSYEEGMMYAYVGYGLSYTRYRLEEGYLGEALGNPVQSYHPPHDRRHSLNAAIQADFGWATASLRWQYGSGLPFTKIIGFDSFFDLRNYPQPDRQLGDPRFLFKKPYRGRLPPYHRLDLSLERTFSWNVADVVTKAGAINAYNRRNLFYFDLFSFRRVDQLPLIPFVAMKVQI